VKTLYDIRSSLEQQLEEYKNKERDERIQGIFWLKKEISMETS